MAETTPPPGAEPSKVTSRFFRRPRILGGRPGGAAEPGPAAPDSGGAPPTDPRGTRIEPTPLAPGTEEPAAPERRSVIRAYGDTARARLDAIAAGSHARQADADARAAERTATSDVTIARAGADAAAARVATEQHRGAELRQRDANAEDARRVAEHEADNAAFTEEHHEEVMAAIEHASAQNRARDTADRTLDRDRAQTAAARKLQSGGRRLITREGRAVAREQRHTAAEEASAAGVEATTAATQRRLAAEQARETAEHEASLTPGQRIDRALMREPDAARRASIRHDVETVMYEDPNEPATREARERLITYQSHPVIAEIMPHLMRETEVRQRESGRVPGTRGAEQQRGPRTVMDDVAEMRAQLTDPRELEILNRFLSGASDAAPIGLDPATEARLDTIRGQVLADGAAFGTIAGELPPGEQTRAIEVRDDLLRRQSSDAYGHSTGTTGFGGGTGTGWTSGRRLS